jgi:hypothetical protein
VNNFVHQCGLAMVDVGDDGYVPDCLHVTKNGRKSTDFFRSFDYLYVKI